MPDYDEIERDFHTQTRPAHPCPSIELLLATGQGVLPPDVELRTAEHLRTCGLCQMLAQDMATLPDPELTQAESARILSKIPREQPASQSPAVSSYRIALAIAAMALVVVSGIAGYRLLQPTSVPATTTASVAPPAAMAPLEKLAPPDMALGMTARGDGQGDAPSAEELLPAFTPYNAGNYSRAKSAFSEIAQRYPKSDLPLLYLGVTDLLLGQDQQAMEALSKAQTLATPERQEAAAWYSAIAAQHLKDPSAAQRFIALCAGSGSYASRACLLTKPSVP